MERNDTGLVDENNLFFLQGGGEMGERIRTYDWEQTPLGRPETWPQSLRTCIRIMLDSRQPIWIGWGKELIKLYNDPYLAIVGGKHPWALGQPASVVWKDIWQDIAPMLRQVMDGGKGTYAESQLLIMERNGYPEETYYTFSYTPVPGDDGRIAGMFCANTDNTDTIISERQLTTLTGLGKAFIDCKTEAEVIDNSIGQLKSNQRDFPFVLYYSYEKGKATLTASTPLREAEASVPKEISLSADHESAHLLNRAIDTQEPQLFEGLQEKIGLMPKGAWEVAPDKAIILPIIQSATKEVYGFLVVGLNPYRLLDEKYADFFSLISDQIVTALADVHAQEQERKRAEALAEIDQAKTAFFTNISHEFRTPLTLMLGSLEELLRKKVDAETTNIVETAHRNSLRLLKLVNNLLDFSRLEAGRTQAQFQRTDLARYTLDLASSFRSTIEHAGLSFQVSCTAINAPVYVDKEMWEKIVFNLLSNAFKYTLQGEISLLLEPQGDNVVLKVSDTGVGIPEKELPKMFQRFHRVQNAGGRTFEGTGIGLSLVKELVQLQGGDISVESEEGKGSTFSITMPIGKEHLIGQQVTEQEADFSTAVKDSFIEDTELSPSVSMTVTKATASEAPTILVVDDNADMRTYIANLLHEKFNVITAGNGAEALEQLKTHKADMVVSDIMMPVMDGIALLKKIKDQPQTALLPVILVSARAGEESKVEGFDIGADDYLIKPFSAKELLARVTAQINVAEKRANALRDMYQLFDEVPFAVAALKGPDLVIEYINKYNLNIWHAEKSDVINKPLFEARPDIRKSAEHIHEEVYTRGMRFEASEIPIAFSRNGREETGYFNAIIDPMRDKDGRIVGQLATSIDVTEITKSRKLLQESKDELAFAIDAADLATWDYNPSTNTFRGNERLRNWFGLTADEEISLDYALSLIATEERETLLTAIRAALKAESGGAFDVVYTIVHPHTGEERKVRAKGKASFNDKGEAQRFNGTLHDVTFEKIAEDALREREALFRTLAETLPQLVWMSDNQGNQEYASQRWVEYTGIQPEGPDTWKEIVHPNEHQRIEREWAHSLAEGVPYSIELRIKSKAGAYRWFQGLAEPVRDKHGMIQKWVGAFTDIHDQKTLREKLENLIDERTRELQRSNEDLQQFAHVASHDLKEPVRKVITFANMLDNSDGHTLSERGRISLNKVHAAAERMMSMVNGVLVYSKLEAAEQTMEMINIEEVINNVEADLEVLIQQKQAMVIKEDLPLIVGAPILIRQLFYNLIGNALKFSKDDVAPRITISGERTEGGVTTITVADNGIGFEPEYADRIFKTFTRLNTKDKYEGTGLGLSLCKKIVERHGGTIMAESKLGHGARFTIELPRIEPGIAMD